MYRRTSWRWVALVTACIGVLGVCRASPVPTATAILGLCDGHGTRIDGAVNGSRQPPDSNVGLNSWLWVVVQTSAEAGETLEIAQDCAGLIAAQPTGSSAMQPSQGAGQAGNSAPVAAAQLDATQYSLILDGREVEGLEEVQYDAVRHAFGFRLTRNDESESVWRSLLGSPTDAHSTVTVALRLREPANAPPATIEGTNGSATFRLQVFSWAWFWVATAVAALVLVFVVGAAWRTTILRDTLLPQLPANEQPYSLGRCQMAFWFILVFVCFVFLYVLLWDYNTVSGQALGLMGIASATALASIAVDVYKDSPADAANRALRALGLNTSSDLPRLGKEIADREPLVTPAVAKRDAARATAADAQTARDRIAEDPDATTEQREAASKAAKQAADLAKAADRDLKALQAEIQDRRNIIRTYQDTVAPFRSESFLSDLTTDLNGPTVHRLQVLVWTLALGCVFLVGVYRDLAMPNFSDTLLALMGISGAGYVGFKYPEHNN